MGGIRGDHWQALRRGAAIALLLPCAAQAQTDAEASRLLIQATFGPTAADITDVRNRGLAGWVDHQLTLAPTLHRPQLELPWLLTAPTPADRQEVWWRRSLTAPDQLRQRVALALSEIMVVSDQNSQLYEQPLLLAEYYDLLLRDAFGNYRQLLEDVTLSPAMGLYLSMIRNDKPDPETGRRPDENYAREVQQLFSIGLWQLNADGSPRLSGGARIPTYGQDTIENFARAFTGWTWADAGTNWWAAGSSYAPMIPFADHHDSDAKTLLNGAAVPAAQAAPQDLDAALDNIFNHPNVGPFIARRLIQRLVTSNPSPAYVQRIAAVFTDNGAGVRGDLRAVVRAILLDAEARAAPSGNSGKLREPLLRLTAVWRAFGASTLTGKYPYPNPEYDWAQAALRAPSVFNFFQPDFRAPGPITAAGLYSPEFQVQTESQGLAMVNAFTRFIRTQYQGAPNTLNGNLILIHVDDEKALAADPAALVAHLDVLLTAGQMPQAMRDVLVNYLNGVPAGDGTQRAIEAIFLVATSPEFSVQK